MGSIVGLLLEPGKASEDMISAALADQLAVILLCIAEASLEDIVIKLKNASLVNYSLLNRQEHRRSAVYYFALIGCLLVLTWEQVDHHVWLVIAFMCLRRIFFTYGLKIYRKRRIKVIEGDQYTDRMIRSLLGKNGGYIELLILLAAVVAINILFLL